jgi:hypothetical protein
MHVLEVRNDELMDSITRQATQRGITYAAIVALIGAVDSFTVSTTPASDPTAHPGRQDNRRTPAPGGARHLFCPRLRDPLRASRRRARQRGDRIRRGPGQPC